MSTPINNACWLGPVEKLERSYYLPRGMSLANDFPKGVQFRMDNAFKKATALTDDLKNGSKVKVCSPKLVGFLQARAVKNLEYLPITILDHKGKVASKEYRIVSPVGLQDALDLDASEPKYNPIKKDQIDTVKKIVIDPKRLDPELDVFRLAGFYFPVFVTRALAEAITAQGFVGPYFRELKDYGK
jgi:hypothetical protein